MCVFIARGFSHIYLAPRTNVFGTVGGGLAVWALFAFPISQVAWSPLTALAVNIVIYAVCIWLTRKMVFEIDTIPSTKPRWFELPLRAFVVGLFVAAVVTLSDALGTIDTGMGAAFPIVFSSLTAILHIRLGGTFLALTMQGALRVVSIMIFAFLVLHYGVLWWGEAIGLSVSLLVSIVFATMFIVLNRRRASAV